MQICEMRTLRTFCSHCQREFRSIIRAHPSVFFSNSPKKGRLLCHFRSPDRRNVHYSNWRCGREWGGDPDRSWGGLGHRSLANEVEQPRVWTSYDPTSDKLVTKISSIDAEAREDALTSDDEEPVTFSSFDSVVEEFGRESSSVSISKQAEEKRSGNGTVGATSIMYNREERCNPRKTEEHRVRSGSDLVARDIGFKRKKGKFRSVWVCSNCGKSSGQWWGTCQSCGSAGTVVEFSDVDKVESRTTGFGVSQNAVRSWLQKKPGEQLPQRLTEVNKGINQSTWRIPLSGLFGAEVERVLGGGIVPGSLVLVGGDPGVGKSTLLLQIAAMVAEGHAFGRQAPVVYVSGEESIEQIGNRADRMRIGTDGLFLYSSTDIEDILEKIQPLTPQALIVDSIQTVYLKGVSGSAGGITQVKECTSALLRFAKDTSIPVFLVGHVTKTGDIAGPRVLEHIVDVVLYMEGEKYSTHRFLRSVKNRFGSTDELGVFDMSSSGLQSVTNPSEIFLSERYFDSKVLAGLAVAVIIDGSRTFLIEIQALCLHDSSVQRQFNGVDRGRADLIIAVLIKQAGLKLQDHGIFVNVVSGVKLDDTAGDLAIAAAICSSFLEFPIPNDVAFIGEIGLGGELRQVPRIDKRVNAVAKLGYKKCIVPKSTEKSLVSLQLEGLTILGCKNMKEVINSVFR